MNQPRFKFGDKVRVTDYVAEPCEIHSIKKEKDGFLYYISGKNFGLEYSESRLELYQEPQKKKLYAFWSEDEDGVEIVFRPVGTHSSMERCPEYDIEYPSSEQRE